MARLTVIAGPGEGESFALEGAKASLGRDPACEVRIRDPKASRVHAELSREGGRWLLRDKGSANGTWSGDDRVSSMPLSDGATFRIGRSVLRFDSRGKAEPAEEPGTEALQGIDRESPSLLMRRADLGPDELQRQNAYLALLHRIVLRSHEVHGREALFDLLDDAAAEALEGERCAVFLPAPEADAGEAGWELYPPHERRLRARFGAVPFARTLLAAVRTRREALRIHQGGELGPSASMIQSGVRAAMAAPLRIGSEMQALLYVDRIEDGRPFSREDLEFLAAVANQLTVRLSDRQRVADLEAEVSRLSAAPARPAPALVGNDEAMRALQAFIAKAGPAPSPVLILGESGTGKELVARAVHRASQRADRPLQVVNCAALAESVVESALFGHVKGAFTGADETRPGVFELADKGTLFLDEIGELPLGVQAKLLRALEQGEVQRVGDGVLRRVDVRLIAATNRDLRAEAADKRFRGDLLHRLDVLSISLPPLRERPGDIEALAEHFLAEHARRLDQPLKKLSGEARAVLLRYPWPGNVRQLRNILERACVLANDRSIRPDDLPAELRSPQAQPAGGGSGPICPLEDVERAHVLRVLQHCGGNKKQAAEILAIDRSTLYAKLRQYGVG